MLKKKTKKDLDMAYKYGLKDFIKAIILLILFSVFFFAVKIIVIHEFGMAKSRDENQSLIDEVVTPVESGEEAEGEESKDPVKVQYVNPEKLSIDFGRLSSINKDTVGWIYFNSGYIHNPIVHTGDNEYYLTHSFYRQKNEAGTIFMDYRNKSFNDKNVVLFGHNTIDNSMFGSLKNILTSEYWNRANADIIYIYDTSNRLIKYQIFSYYTIINEEYYITTNFKNDAEFGTFVNTVKNRSLKKFNNSVTGSDRIITLSTCYGSMGTNKRLVVHAKRI